MKVRKLFGILLLISVFFAALIAFYYHDKYRSLLDENLQSSAEDALNQLAYTQREYTNLYGQMLSVLDLLKYNQTLTDFILTPDQQHQAALTDLWSSVLLNQKWYTRISLLDLSGYERFRVNYDLNVGVFLSQAPAEDVSKDPFFASAQALKNDETGVWGVTLEEEQGQLKQPYTPVMRIFAPVTIRNQRVGYLVMNLNIHYMASRLHYSPVQDFNVDIINQRGYYVVSDQPEKLFGDYLPERELYRFSKLYPQSWQKFSQQQAGYFYDNNCLVVFNTLVLGSHGALHLVIDMSEEQLMARSQQAVNELIREALIVFCVVMLFVLPVTTVALHYRRHSIESKLARAALNGMTAVMISNTSHRIILVNREFEQMFGYDNQQIESKRAYNLIFLSDDLDIVMQAWNELQKNDVWEGEIRCQTYFNQVLTAIMRIQAVKNSAGKVSYYITSLVDITARKQLEERLRHLSEKDELTQIWNRRKFEEQLQYHASLLERYPATPTICLALVDIDHFKRINDEQGHDEGDRVIKGVASLLLQSLRNTDFLARVGGEEFAIIMPHTTISAAEVVLNRLRIAINVAKDLDVTVSIGFTDLTSNTTRSYKCADIALYDAKSSGRNRVSLCYSDDDIA